MNNGMIFKENELTDVLSGTMVLNEAYFGKTKELLAAEQQLDKFRNKYLNSYLFNPKANSDPDLIEFDRIMEKIFGFGCFTLQITNSDIVNAMTISIDGSIDSIFHSNNVIVDKNGYRFKPEFDYSCIVMVYSSIIFDPKFTTAEVMGIILHEVGHNFQSVIDKKDGIMLKFYMTTLYLINTVTDPGSGLINIALLNTKTRSFIAKNEKILRDKNSIFISIYDSLQQCFDLLTTYKNNIRDLLDVLNLGIIKGIPMTLYRFIKSPIMGILNLKAGYTKEQIADNFASMYGYGGDLTNALAKMDQKSRSTIMSAVDKIPIVSTIIHINELSFLMVSSLFDVHPEDVYRVKDQIKLLEHELDKGDIDPKMANVIRSDIKQCEEALDALTDCTRNIKDPYFGKKLYNKILSKMTSVKGKIFGSSHRYEEYDKIFNKGGN